MVTSALPSAENMRITYGREMHRQMLLKKQLQIITSVNMVFVLMMLVTAGSAILLQVFIRAAKYLKV